MLSVFVVIAKRTQGPLLLGCYRKTDQKAFALRLLSQNACLKGLPL